MANSGGSDNSTILKETHEQIIISKDKIKYMNNNYEKVSAKMYDYHCDIKLQVGTETFRAHKHVLTEASDYFSAMFSHNMVEKEKDAIELKEISPRGFRAMMDYFYHGHITIELNNVEDILEAARFFHIEWLISVCRDFLVKRLSIENFLKVLDLADRYFLGDLRSDIFKFLAYRFQHLSDQTVFMEVSYELLHALLAEHHYIDANEGHIFNMLCRWLAHDPEGRTQYKNSLLNLIRFPLIEAEQLEDMSSDILEDPNIDKLVQKAKYYHDNPSRQCLLNSEDTTVRGAQRALVLYSAVDDCSQIQYKIPDVNDFFSEKPDTEFMHTLFEFASVTVLGNFLFAVGGYKRDSWCSSPALYRYNPRNRLWAQLSSMQQPRVSFSLCAAEKSLYSVTGIEHIVMDGMDRELILHSVEQYDPMENMWHFLPELPLGCFSAASCVVEEKLYVSGGISDDPEDNIPVSYLHMYNPEDQTWQPKARMLVEHQAHSMVPYGRKLYVFGGYRAAENSVSFNDNHKSEVYNIDTNQWTWLTDTDSSFQHFHSSATCMDGIIYMLGGKDAMKTLHKFDVEKEKFLEVEVCGQDVLKIVQLDVALPLDAL